METSPYANKYRFLILEGGPLYRFERRANLIWSRSYETKRRALFSILLTWVPLFILAAIQGQAFGNKVTMTFLGDFGAYTRFLVAIPLLLAAETFLGPRIADAAAHFVSSGVVKPKDFQKFDEASQRGLRLRDSSVAEFIFAILAYGIVIASSQRSAIAGSTWHNIDTAAGTSTSWAGWWLLVFCAPLLQFLFLRWLWRLFLWFQFLNSMGNLDLKIFPTHPDEAGGLAFVGGAQEFFGILLFAYSAAVTGVLASQVVYGGVALSYFVVPIALYVILGIVALVGPLVIFTRKLLKTKRLGLHQYGTLATAYTGSFHDKWVRGNNENPEPLLGTADIQSLADLGNSYALIQHMNAIPIHPRSILRLVVVMLLPMAPLLLTVMSPREIAKLLLKLMA